MPGQAGAAQHRVATPMPQQHSPGYAQARCAGSKLTRSQRVGGDFFCQQEEVPPAYRAYGLAYGEEAEGEQGAGTAQEDEGGLVSYTWRAESEGERGRGLSVCRGETPRTPRSRLGWQAAGKAQGQSCETCACHYSLRALEAGTGTVYVVQQRCRARGLHSHLGAAACTSRAQAASRPRALTALIVKPLCEKLRRQNMSRLS